jgi:riboflavin synthase
MFTGLIEDLGTVRTLRRSGKDVRIELSTSISIREVVLGDSIAVNGVCLTATELGQDWFAADASAETLASSSLGTLRPGSKVHLERALKLGGRLDGHIVQGHVDGTGEVISNRLDGAAWQLWIRAASALVPEICAKGSIAVDGVSLTVNELNADAFRLTIVPFTTTKTRLHLYRPGDIVNIETDILGKYVRRLLLNTGAPSEGAAPTGGMEQLLSRFGYL